MCMSWEIVGNHIADCESNEPDGPVLGTCQKCGEYGILEGHECKCSVCSRKINGKVYETLTEKPICIHCAFGAVLDTEMTTIPAGLWWPEKRRRL